MAVLNIDKLLGKGKNRIELVGIELEGAFKKAIPGVQIHRDTSVKDFPEHMSFFAIGEVSSPPMAPILIDPWVTKCYPSHVNHTCGLHIHQSFASPLNYMRLMVEDYQDTMLEYLKRWAEEENIPKDHCFWERIEGTTEYCQKKFWPEMQVRQRKKDYDRKKVGHRYTVINYCHGLNNMGTIEVRVLPMFPTPQQSIRALYRVVDITNACLVALTRKEKPVVAEFDMVTGSDAYVDQSVSIYR